MRYTRLTLIFVLVLIISACGSGDSSYVGPIGTGGIAVKAVWPNNPGAPDLQQKLLSAPAGVTNVRMTVTGPGMTTLQSTFPVAQGSGSIAGVLAGSGRTLTMEGLDATNAVIYTGKVNYITVVAGNISDCGTLYMKSMTPIAPPTLAPAFLTEPTTTESQAFLVSPSIATTTTGISAVTWLQQDALTSTSRVLASANTGTGWMPDLIIAEASDVSAPKIALTSIGTAMIVWSQWVTDKHVVYARYYNGSWSAAAAVSSGGDAVNPQIVEADGNFLLLYPSYDSVGQTYTIYTNKYVSGTGWSGNTAVATGLSHDHDAHIATSASAGGIGRSFMLAWRDAAGDIVYSSSVNGTTWTAGKAAVTAATSPRIAADSTNYMITAVGPSSFSVVSSVTITYSGASWSAGFPITAITGYSSTTLNECDLIGSAGGAGFALACVAQIGATGNYAVVVHDGSVWTGNTGIDATGSTTTWDNLRLASSPATQRYSLIVRRNRSDGIGYFTRMYNVTNTAWTNEAPLAAVNAVNPSMIAETAAIERSGNDYLVIYGTYYSAPMDPHLGAFMAAKRSTAGVWSSATDFLNTPRQSDAFDTQLITNQNGDTLAIWTRMDGSMSYVSGNGLGAYRSSILASMNTGTSGWSTPVVLYSGAASSPYASFKIAYLRTNGSGFLVLWAVSVTPNFSAIDGYAAVYERGLWSPITKLSTNNMTFVEAATDGSGYAVVLRENLGGTSVNHVIGRVYDPATMTWSAPAQIDSSNYDLSFPYVASNGNNYIVTWRQFAESGKSYGHVYRSIYNGTWGTPELVSNAANNATLPKIAANNSGEYGVAWLQSASGITGPYDVLFSRSSGSSTSPSWSTPVKINTSQPTSAMTSRMASNGTDFAFAWIDSTNPVNSLTVSVATGTSWSETTLDTGHVNRKYINFFDNTILMVGNSTGYALAWDHRDTVSNQPSLATAISNGGTWNTLTSISTSTIVIGRADLIAGTNNFALAWDYSWLWAGSAVCPGCVIPPASPASPGLSWLRVSNGGSWGAATPLGGANAYYPAITTNGNTYSVIWSETGAVNDAMILNPKVHLGGF